MKKKRKEMQGKGKSLGRASRRKLHMDVKVWGEQSDKRPAARVSGHYNAIRILELRLSKHLAS